jgi:hypothetical protein
MSRAIGAARRWLRVLPRLRQKQRCRYQARLLRKGRAGHARRPLWRDAEPLSRCTRDREPTRLRAVRLGVQSAKFVQTRDRFVPRA